MAKSKQSPLGDGKPSPSGVLPEEFADDPDFEADDDIIASRKATKSKAAAPPARAEPDSAIERPDFEPAVAVEADAVDEDPDRETDDDIIASRKPDPKKFSVTTTPVNALLLLLALVVGIVLGVWISGQFRTTPTEVVPSATATELSAAEIAARIADLEQVLADNPDDVDALLDLGVLLFNYGTEEGDLEKAASYWTHVIELKTDKEAYGWYYLAYYYMAQPDGAGQEQAMEALQKVIELAPGTDIAVQAQTHLDAWSRQPDITPTMPQTVNSANSDSVPESAEQS